MSRSFIKSYVRPSRGGGWDWKVFHEHSDVVYGKGWARVKREATRKASRLRQEKERRYD